MQNLQIDTQELPKSESLVFEKLHTNYRKVSIYFTLIFFCILFIVYVVVGFFVAVLFQWPIIMLSLTIWLILLGISVFVASKSYDYEGFALREKDISYTSGMFFKSTLIIPFNRVQHCEIEQGPIDRLFGLSELTFYTAGGSSSDMSIPGLTHEKAQSLKNYITTKMATDEEE